MKALRLEAESRDIFLSLEDKRLGYICMYGDKRWETYADSLYDAKKKAIAHFKVKPKAEHRVSVYLAEKNGEDVMQVAS